MKTGFLILSANDKSITLNRTYKSPKSFLITQKLYARVSRHRKFEKKDKCCMDAFGKQMGRFKTCQEDNLHWERKKTNFVY